MGYTSSGNLVPFFGTHWFCVGLNLLRAYRRPFAAFDGFNKHIPLDLSFDSLANASCVDLELNAHRSGWPKTRAIIYQERLWPSSVVRWIIDYLCGIVQPRLVRMDERDWFITHIYSWYAKKNNLVAWRKVFRFIPGFSSPRDASNVRLWSIYISMLLKLLVMNI